MKPDTLIAPSGAYNRAAIMRDAHRQFHQMRRHGWTWRRCLSFAYAKANAMQAHATADPDKVERAMVRPTPEGAAAMFTALTGRDVTPEELESIQAKLDAAERAKNTDETLKARGFIKLPLSGKGFGFIVGRKP